jgi:hypothetical protein
MTLSILEEAMIDQADLHQVLSDSARVDIILVGL